MNRIRRLLGAKNPASVGFSIIPFAITTAAVLFAIVFSSHGINAQTQEKSPTAIPKNSESSQEESNQDTKPAEVEEARDQVKLADLELELAEAEELDKLTTAEFLTAEKMSELGQLSMYELLVRNRRQLDGQYRFQRAKRELEMARTGQWPAPSLDHLELEYYGMSHKIVRKALAEIEAQCNRGMATQLQLLEARREEAKAKFQLERVKLKQSKSAKNLGVRVVIPAMGPAPTAIDFELPITVGNTDARQLFSFMIGIMR